MAQNPTLVKKKVLGDLEAIALFDICQFLMIGRKTGTLRVESRGRRATLTWIDGQIVGAIDEGLKEGEGALARVLGWTNGTFEFAPGPVAAGSPSRITTPTDALLLEAARHLDEAAAARGDADAGGAPHAAAFLEKQRFARELADLFSSLEPPSEEELDFRKEVPLETLLGIVARRGAWGLSLRAGETPKARGPHGWVPLGRSPVTQRAADRIASQFLGGSEKILLEMREHIVREKLVEGIGYVRMAATREEDLTRLDVTMLQSDAPSAAEVGLTDERLRALAQTRAGFVLIASAPRGGKSRLAAALAAASAAGPVGRHIVFYEEARRFRLREESGIVEHCDLSAETTRTGDVLEKVWRQKANVVVLDAVRCGEHFAAALGAASAGALAIAAVQAEGVVDAVARALWLADEAARPALAEQLATQVVAVVALRAGRSCEIVPQGARLCAAIRSGDAEALAACVEAVATPTPPRPAPSA
jgi:Tfp pilus assembly pilus retraction ATPase PilT